MKLPLRPLLWFDAATCLAMGGLLAVANGPLTGLLGLPAMLLQGCVILLVVFAGVIAFVATRANPVTGTRLIAIGNIAWVIAGFVFIAGPWVEPTALGIAFVAVQAVAVAGLAVLELAAIRSAPAAA